MTGRREFLKAAGGGTLAVTRVDGSDVRRAREMVRRGELGAIHYCRVGHPGFRAAALCILGQRDCVIEIERETEGVAILGSGATLVVGREGWRVFA